MPSYQWQRLAATVTPCERSRGDKEWLAFLRYPYSYHRYEGSGAKVPATSATKYFVYRAPSQPLNQSGDATMSFLSGARLLQRERRNVPRRCRRHAVIRLKIMALDPVSQSRSVYEKSTAGYDASRCSKPPTCVSPLSQPTLLCGMVTWVEVTNSPPISRLRTMGADWFYNLFSTEPHGRRLQRSQPHRQQQHRSGRPRRKWSRRGSAPPAPLVDEIMDGNLSRRRPVGGRSQSVDVGQVPVLFPTRRYILIYSTQSLGGPNAADAVTVTRPNSRQQAMVREFRKLNSPG